MPTSTDSIPRYWVYFNYTVALARLIRQLYPTDRHLVEIIVNSLGYTKVMSSSTVNPRELAKTLRHSWFTELALRETGTNQALLLYASPWCVIQSYYAVYLATRAYFLATGRVVGTHHETTLRTLASDLISCKERFPPPWGTILAGDPAASPLQLTCTPAPVQVKLRNPLAPSAKGDPWQYYGLFLKTTRDRQIRRLITDWKRKNRKKKIKRAERRLLVDNLRPTTFFDGLYRLRVRSNYQDIDSFAFGNATPNEAAELHRALGEIVHTSLLVFEMLIARITGPAWFNTVVRELLASPLGQPAGQTIGARWLEVSNDR